METGNCLIYDGTFEGFMTGVAVALENRLRVARMAVTPSTQSGLFTREERIVADRRLAEAVWDSIGSRGSGLQRMVYFAFLAAKREKELALFNYLQLLLQGEKESESDKRQELRCRLETWASQVEAEKLTIESRLTLKPTTSGIPCGLITPQHDVLPLLSRYFRMRYGATPWIVFDSKRQYGLKSENGSVAVIRHFPSGWGTIDSSPRVGSEFRGLQSQPAYRTAV